MRDFKRRERVNVDRRYGLEDGAHQSQIGVARVGWMNAALEADFGGPGLTSLEGAPSDFLECEIIRSAAQMIAELAFRKGTEAARVTAHVGVVDVAVDHVGDDVGVDLCAQAVSSGANLIDLRSAGREQAHDLVFVQSISGGGAVEQRRHAPAAP